MDGRELLEVSDLRVHFRLPRPLPFAPSPQIFAVDGISFAISRGSTLELVGESGCGKSTTALALLRLVEPTAGQIWLDGVDLTALSADEMRLRRRRMQIIFQDPYSSLNPRQTAGDIVREPLDVQRIGTTAERQQVTKDLFGLVGLRTDQLDLYPHQLSGGQRQRLGIARALSLSPELIVCDEPVSSLDVAIRAQILNLLVRLQGERGLSYLFISHDLAVVEHMSDEVAVMYRGRIVERSIAADFFREPAHPYSRRLIAAVPSLRAKKSSARPRSSSASEPLNALQGGCRYRLTCPIAEPRCIDEEPVLREIASGHFAACHLA